MGSSSLWSDIRANPLVVLLAIALHVVLLLLLSISLLSSEVPDRPATTKKTVKAVMVDAEKVDAEIKKLKQAEDKEKQRELEQQKKSGSRPTRRRKNWQPRKNVLPS